MLRQNKHTEADLSRSKKGGRRLPFGALLALLCTVAVILSACAPRGQKISGPTVGESGKADPKAIGSQSIENRKALEGGWSLKGSMELKFAKNFAIDYYDDHAALITLADGSRFMILDEGRKAAFPLPKDVVSLSRPVNQIYLVASAAVCLFDALDALENLRFLAAPIESWPFDKVQAAMKTGKITNAGKYNRPDYELILSEKCQLAIQNTMIYHSPEVKEKLESMGLPVLVDQAALEAHPLGRSEWIKLYAYLTKTEAKGQEIFAEQETYLDKVRQTKFAGRKVAFFYINSSGAAVLRRQNDYLTAMIEMAGGVPISADEQSRGTSNTTSIDMERFYAIAKDADIILYNSTVDGGLKSIAELLAKNNLLADFKAVQNKEVWCTDQNFYRQSIRFGRFIYDLQQILNGVEPEPGSDLFKLR